MVDNFECEPFLTAFSFERTEIKYLKYVIQANAASAVDQFKVAQDRTLALIIHVFIAQLRHALRAPWVTKYGNLSMLEIRVLVTTLCVRPVCMPETTPQRERE